MTATGRRRRRLLSDQGKPWGCLVPRRKLPRRIRGLQIRRHKCGGEMDYHAVLRKSRGLVARRA